jgi:hypothetical protein
VIRFVTKSSANLCRQHVYRDLHPYCCTHEYCTIADRLYDSRKAWFAHELEAHRKAWQCVEGCDKTFEVESDFETHVRKNHSDLASASMFSALKRTSAKSADLGGKTQCTLCGKYMALRALQRHLGNHQQQLALFALPPNLEDTEDDPNDDDGELAIAGNIDEDLSDMSDTSDPEVANDIAELNLRELHDDALFEAFGKDLQHLRSFDQLQDLKGDMRYLRSSQLEKVEAHLRRLDKPEKVKRENVLLRQEETNPILHDISHLREQLDTGQETPINPTSEASGVNSWMQGVTNSDEPPDLDAQYGSDTEEPLVVSVETNEERDELLAHATSDSSTVLYDATSPQEEGETPTVHSISDIMRQEADDALGVEDKLRIAHKTALAYLQYYDTTWLPERWRTEQIIYSGSHSRVWPGMHLEQAALAMTEAQIQRALLNPDTSIPNMPGSEHANEDFSPDTELPLEPAESYSQSLPFSSEQLQGGPYSPETPLFKRNISLRKLEYEHEQPEDDNGEAQEEFANPDQHVTPKQTQSPALTISPGNMALRGFHPPIRYLTSPIASVENYSREESPPRLDHSPMPSATVAMAIPSTNDEAPPPLPSVMSIPRARDGLPPPLPSPRYIKELRSGQDRGWQWGNTNSSRMKVVEKVPGQQDPGRERSDEVPPPLPPPCQVPSVEVDEDPWLQRGELKTNAIHVSPRSWADTVQSSVEVSGMGQSTRSDDDDLNSDEDQPANIRKVQPSGSAETLLADTSSHGIAEELHITDLETNLEKMERAASSAATHREDFPDS